VARGDPRETALRALVESEEKDEFIDQALHYWLSKTNLDRRDRALATELAYGVIRHRATLDHALNLVASRPLESQPVILKNILRLGAYQLLFLESIPDHAAVNESVVLARRFGHPGLVRFTNGVLRALGRQQDPLRLDEFENTIDRLAVEYSYPRWLVRRWLDRWGEERARRLLAVGNRRPTVTLRVNTLRTDRPGLIATLKAEGAEAVPASLHAWAIEYVDGPPVHSLRSFRDGLFVVQGEASMVVADVVGALPGEVVLDACAAPGGKTTQLAQRMDDTGRIFALDASSERLQQVRENTERLGLNSVVVVEADAREAWKAVPQVVDRVLVDVPCSNLGVLARRADARWNRTETDVSRLAALQLELLRGSAWNLKPGGTLVYSTCTLEPEENEQVVREFMASMPGFELDSLCGRVPTELLGDDESGYLQLYPDVHGTDGMFFARLRRSKEVSD